MLHHNLYLYKNSKSAVLFTILFPVLLFIPFCTSSANSFATAFASPFATPFSNPSATTFATPFSNSVPIPLSILFSVWTAFRFAIVIRILSLTLDDVIVQQDPYRFPAVPIFKPLCLFRVVLKKTQTLAEFTSKAGNVVDQLLTFPGQGITTHSCKGSHPSPKWT